MTASLNTCWTVDLRNDFAPLPPGCATADVVVIGGGLMGTAITYWLARERCDVVLLESAHLAAGSTGRNAGLVLHGASEIEDPALVREVQELEGLEINYQVPGHLSLASSPAVWEQFQAEVRRRPAWAPPLMAIETSACEDLLHMRIDARYPGGRWYPGGAVIHPARFACELARAATSRGARIHTGTTVARIDAAHSGVLVRAGHATIAAAAVVHATAASSTLLPEFATVVRPVRLQAMASDPLPPLFSIGLGVNWGDVFGRQLSDGRFVLGGGGGTPITGNLEASDTIDPDVQSRLRDFLPRTFPEFPAFTVRQMWTGVLDCTPDGKPLVGAHPWKRGEWMCCGFNGHGLPAALGAGRALMSAMQTGVTPSALQAWSPARSAAACASSTHG
jgi:glycine/D-amino acid oxidase-like deaminating enzyme